MQIVLTSADGWRAETCSKCILYYVPVQITMMAVPNNKHLLTFYLILALQFAWFFISYLRSIYYIYLKIWLYHHNVQHFTIVTYHVSKKKYSHEKMASMLDSELLPLEALILYSGLYFILTYGIVIARQRGYQESWQEGVEAEWIYVFGYSVVLLVPSQSHSGVLEDDVCAIAGQQIPIWIVNILLILKAIDYAGLVTLCGRRNMMKIVLKRGDKRHASPRNNDDMSCD